MSSRTPSLAAVQSELQLTLAKRGLVNGLELGIKADEIRKLVGDGLCYEM